MHELVSAWEKILKHERFVETFEHRGIRLAIVGPAKDLSRNWGPMPTMRSWGWVDPLMRDWSGGTMTSRDDALLRAKMRCDQLADLDDEISAASCEAEG